MSDNQESEEAYTGDISNDIIATGQEWRTRLNDGFTFLENNNREEAAAEIDNWIITQGVKTYSVKSFGTFVWKAIENGECEDLMEAHRLFVCLPAHGTKLPPQNIDQMVSARTLFDSNVQAEKVDHEREAWKKYYLEKLKEQEDECGRSLSRRKARLERENEACPVEISHK